MLSTKYIKATSDYSTFERAVNAPYVRKTFELDSIPEKGVIELTCTGFYRLFVNGKEITDGRLAPNITNPDEIIFYDSYDITSLLLKGKNCIALILGNGISNAPGGYIWEFDTAKFRSAPKLALAFSSKEVSFEADTSFKCAPSPIIFDDLRCGEFYDANLEIDGWNTPDFDDSDWCSMTETDPARGKAVLNDTDRIVITKELKPVRIYDGFSDLEAFNEIQLKKPGSKVLEYSENAFYKPELKEYGTVFEFDENTACVPKLRINGKKGQQIIIQAAEYCDKNGKISYDNIHLFYPYGFCQRDIYTCKGDGVEEYVPSFTYHGARYFLVIGLDKEQISEDTLTMLVTNSDLAERGNFSCSDEIANALQRNTRISTLANFVYFPTDCPHREKNGWTGDAAASAEHMTQNLAVERSLRQWLRMMCEAQRTDGAFSGIVPNSGWGYAWGDGHGPVWDSVLIEVPYQTYIYRGDTEIFRECAVYLTKYLHFLTTKVRPDGLIRIGLGDWCHALRGGDSHNHLCPNEVSDSIICFNIARKCEFMYNVCGMKPQAAFAKTFGDALLASIRERLIDFDTMTVYSACQCAQAMGLYYGIFEKGEEAAAYARLIELIHDADDHFDCGMIGVRTMFRVLAKHGDGALAYKMITRTDAPSYGIWVKEFDLRSMAESFHETVDGVTTSLNHHFMADISGFFIAHIAGLQINPHKNDPSCVRIAPTFVPSLDYADAHYDTVAGKIYIKWERDGELIKLHVDKADGVYGDIILPKGRKFVSKNGVSDVVMNGRSVFHIMNGTYIIK